MIVFYKYYIIYITEKAVNPDARRYVVDGEAPKHFIDADVYDQYYGGKGTAIYKLPRYWKDAVAEFGIDTLQAYGIGPWNVEEMKHRLTRAFERRDTREILRLSSDLGHYVADINVPLHTTENYNGQLTNQKGIHGFWESRLPELFSDEYDLFVGQAHYLENTQLTAWEAVINAHMALDSVLDFERILTERFDESKKY
ncbi:MAG: integrase, partial [Saprospiraceae bacterium]|nr:integrase [Saprospiraceae bacterium]